MLTISKRTLVQLFVLAMGGVGLAMAIGVLIGSQLGHTTETIQTETAAAAEPLSCELTPVLSAEEIAWLNGLAGAGTVNDYATNSGTIDGSQFNDGGFGDIGQQWWNVNVDGDVTNIHISGNGNVVTTGNEITVETPPATPPVDVTSQTTPPTTTPPTTTPPTTTPPTTTSVDPAQASPS